METCGRLFFLDLIWQQRLYCLWGREACLQKLAYSLWRMSKMDKRNHNLGGDDSDQQEFNGPDLCKALISWTISWIFWLLNQISFHTMLRVLDIVHMKVSKRQKNEGLELWPISLYKELIFERQTIYDSNPTIWYILTSLKKINSGKWGNNYTNKRI